MISTPEQTHGAGALWDRFTEPTERFRRPLRRWRRARPFYAGLSILLSGLEIYAAPHTGVGKLLSMGLPGISSLFIPIFLAIFAATIWFFPAYRVFSGIASIMFALLSLVATNLGGFFLGFLLGMLGGAFAVAWTPRADYTADTRRQRRAVVRQNPEEAEEPAAAGGAVAQTATLPAQAGPAEDVEGAPSDGQSDETRVIEQATRSEQAAPAAADPAPEEE